MADAQPRLLNTEARSDWIRLRTLVALRWLAVGGQLSAVVIASAVLKVAVPVPACLVVISISAALNLLSLSFYPPNRRLTEREVLGFLLFDIVQLSVLLGLTGGINNPFALLILAPVTIAATALRLYATVVAASAAVGLITLVSVFNLPLRDAQGAVLQLPPLFAAGFWVALVLGVIVLAGYSRRVTLEIHTMAEALSATQLALAREQKLTDLSGVVAAAAHELGTPLATIKLVSTELAEDLANDPDRRADIELIRQQADRCTQILRDMGRAGKDDRYLAAVPLPELVRNAAEPHMERGKEVIIGPSEAELGARKVPVVRRSPEIIHGLRNLVQNAVDFARQRVWIDIEWDDRQIRVRVADDGRGYPPDMVGRLGDPFVRRRASRPASSERPGYEGMGLGLFIAKTLLERTGARLVFANGSTSASRKGATGERSGAIAEATWPRKVLETDPEADRRPLGANQRISTE